MGFKTPSNPPLKGGEGEISFRFRLQIYYKYLECARFLAKKVVYARISVIFLPKSKNQKSKVKSMYCLFLQVYAETLS